MAPGAQAREPFFAGRPTNGHGPAQYIYVPQPAWRLDISVIVPASRGLSNGACVPALNRALGGRRPTPCPLLVPPPARVRGDGGRGLAHNTGDPSTRRRRRIIWSCGTNNRSDIALRLRGLGGSKRKRGIGPRRPICEAKGPAQKGQRKAGPARGTIDFHVVLNRLNLDDGAACGAGASSSTSELGRRA